MEKGKFSTKCRFELWNTISTRQICNQIWSNFYIETMQDMTNKSLCKIVTNIVIYWLCIWLTMLGVSPCLRHKFIYLFPQTLLVTYLTNKEGGEFQLFFSLTLIYIHTYMYNLKLHKTRWTKGRVNHNS